MKRPVYRRTRECTEEDFSKMGEFPFGACGVPHRRPLCGYEGWQDAHQASRGPLWRETGTYLLFLSLVLYNLETKNIFFYNNKSLLRLDNNMIS